MRSVPAWQESQVGLKEESRVAQHVPGASAGVESLVIVRLLHVTNLRVNLPQKELLGEACANRKISEH